MLGVFALSFPLIAAASSHAENAFYLYNSSETTTVNFKYGCTDQETLFLKHLPPRTGMWYWNTNGCRFYKITVKTSDGPLYTYDDAQAGHKYEFYYNRDRGEWIIDAY